MLNLPAGFATSYSTSRLDVLFPLVKWASSACTVTLDTALDLTNTEIPISWDPLLTPPAVHHPLKLFDFPNDSTGANNKKLRVIGASLASLEDFFVRLVTRFATASETFR